MNHNDMTQQLHDVGLTGEEIRNVLGALDGRTPESPQDREPIYADFAENTQKLVDAIARIDARTGKPETIAYREGSLLESELAARIGAEYLRGKFIAWGRNMWSKWDGRRWATLASDTPVYGAMRAAVNDLATRETEAANKRLTDANKTAENLPEEEQAAARKRASAEHHTRTRQINGLFLVGKIQTLMKGAREVLLADPRDFDNQPDLLNVANGVVDLRTGELQTHDPAWLFTKVADTAYRPDAEHHDWDKALTALPDDVAEWMRVRFGQAATGYPASDDVVPFLTGGGANGKSSVLAGVINSLGDFSTSVPDRVLLGNTSDHPTELMTLKGARFAYIEELPEGDYLNGQRLKKIAGTEEITARYIGENNVTWTATHSMFITTNYDVKVDAVDHGTWRRLAYVRFPYCFKGANANRVGDNGLRDRIKYGKEQHEAALAWVVSGARDWYDAGKEMPETPESVRRDTDAWRNDANQAVKFLDELFERDAGSAVKSADVYTAFAEWAANHGMRKWSDQTFWSRAQQHSWFVSGDVQKPSGSVRTNGWHVSAASGRATVGRMARLVTGIRFADDGAVRTEGPGIFAKGD